LLNINRRVRSIEGIDKHNIPPELIEAREPVVLKQLVAEWPLAAAGRDSPKDAVDYLKCFYNGRSTIVCKIAPEHRGRLFYDENLENLQYESYKGRIDETLDAILDTLAQPAPPGFYIASNNIETHLPGLGVDNSLTIPRQEFPGRGSPTVSIWIGNATTASCHFDALDNIACCVAGRRKFTLFPPFQVGNLYPGPLEPTPGGQVISLVDFRNPDYFKFPRFKEALDHACVAELEPGDALYIPSMWWHHVESLGALNLLINYWWNEAPPHMISGMTALYAAMLGIRDKPTHEREGWKALFDYYIFGGPEPSQEHIPEKAQGFLKRIDMQSARKLRALLINKLNR
jgi:Uncharacterized conserved protein